MRNKRKEFSKKLCFLSFSLFSLISLSSIIATFLGIGTNLWDFLIPTAGGFVSICFGFYFNKAKAENLSKQRLRTTFIKFVLEGKLDEESYRELEEELNNIDDTLQNKIDEMYREAINEENDTSLSE